MAVEVEDLLLRYGLSTTTAAGPTGASAWHGVVRLPFPNGWLAATSRRNVGRELVALGQMARQGAAAQD